MRTQAAQPVEFTPLFDWSPPRRRKLAIVSFIVASAALHALCFYLFQVIYPPTVALLPPPARVSLITPASEQGRVLLRWIEAEDPALLSTTQRPPGAAAPPLPEPAHVPSYANRIPALRIPPEPSLVPPIPSAQPPGPVPVTRPTPAPKVVLAPSVLRFADETAALGKLISPPLQFTASRTEPPQPALFRVAIDGSGVVRHCFLEASSGDPALDGQARSAIVLSRFAHATAASIDTDRPLVWTTATLEWGNDVALPGAPASASPNP